MGQGTVTQTFYVARMATACWAVCVTEQNENHFWRIVRTPSHVFKEPA